ncbi:MAG TPA: hypothetical protein VMM56_09830, partial [Planctomycetaceae bacterium]|nr:hypothetical protein [Planctomycetaceae bacterium]
MSLNGPVLNDLDGPPRAVIDTDLGDHSVHGLPGGGIMKYLLAVLVAIPWIVLGLIEFQTHRAQQRDQEQHSEELMKIQEVWKAVTRPPADSEQ